MAVTPLRIPTLTQQQPFVDKDGRLTTESLRRLNDIFKSIGYTLNAILAIPEIQAQLEALDDAIIAAQNAADNANAAADGAKAESSIVASFPTGYTPPLISADNLGNVTIANHQRQYGDPTLNPTVAVTGGVLATGAAALAIVRVYYDDPTRAGGAVTYQFTVDPTAAPVQGGNRHSVGAVEIPAAGSQDGNGLQPPGYVNVN